MIKVSIEQQKWRPGEEILEWLWEEATMQLQFMHFCLDTD